MANNEYHPDVVSHPIDTFKELRGDAGMIDELTLLFFKSRIDHYADYVAERRIAQYKDFPFLCKFRGHKYKIVRWNRYFIPTARICVRCNHEQEHTFSLKNESGDNLWMDVVDGKEELTPMPKTINTDSKNKQ